MASQDSLRFFARTISQQGKGGKTVRQRGKKKQSAEQNLVTEDTSESQDKNVD